MGHARVAIAHDYLTQRGGAERVVLAMARAFPDAPIYTTLYEPDATFAEFRDLDVRVSPLNRIPLLRRNHRAALPLLPRAIDGITIDADVVIASSSGWAHGVRTTGRKIVYCHLPARWLYYPDHYLGDHAPLTARMALSLLQPYLRRWDQAAAQSADTYLTVSTAVQERIRHIYGRSAPIVPPPFSNAAVAELDATHPAAQMSPGFYLVVSRLVPYKNVGTIVEAFNGDPSRRLVVAGSGPESERLRALAHPNITFVDGTDDAELAWLYHHCRALVAIGYEDYGLTPLEAAAAGKPSIVLHWGGYLDTMIEGKTAVFVDTPTPAALHRATEQVEAEDWDPQALRDHAEGFSDAVFIERLRAAVRS